MLAKGPSCILLGLMSFVGIAKGFIADLSILAFTGTPVGKVIPFNGRYVTVAPDLFEGKPRSEDPKAGFNGTEFFGAHGPTVTDPKVEKAITYMREQMGIEKIASTGYCFGGRYAFRALGIPQNKGVQVGFAAHPTLLGDEEIKGIKGPASLAIAEGDTGMMAKRRAEIEAAMGSTGQPFTMALYGRTPHGFATHPDLNNPVQKAAKEDAFLQAVRFYETWL
ncbi:dienelactone hydrolase [Colletotrichum tofieldiae]|nr:dienelactone hydrolase [Colletotrichum tofieldiae]GKT73982.1 dienelactone hydrolase [Colletotrichum tofieldiae]GKT95967.1 dienelactone hydrolase [Colletotrichum tofieldiae]